MKKSIFIFLILGLSIVSCNKEKTRSNRLIKGDVWNVEEVKVNGNDLQIFGEWIIAGDDIYNKVSSAKWQYEGQESVFQWQFQSKGKRFQLNYVQLCEECEGEQLSDLDYFTYDISGSYDVVKCSRKSMEFKSFETIGHYNKEISIKIVRK